MDTQFKRLFNQLFIPTASSHIFPIPESMFKRVIDSKDSKIFSHYHGHHKNVTKISFSVKQWPRPRTAKCIKGLFPTSCHDI